MLTVEIRRQRKDPGLLTRLVRLFKRPSPRVKVGFPAGKTDADEIQKAIWNEFGTAGGASGGGWGGPIPERPFVRNAMRNNRGKYADGLRNSASKLVQGKGEVDQVLNKLGILAQGDIQAEITALATPPNSPVTVKLKGSNNPLVDTGGMRGAVTWEIEK